MFSPYPILLIGPVLIVEKTALSKFNCHCCNYKEGIQASRNLCCGKFAIAFWLFDNFGDRIKGLKLWRFGKLKFTFNGKLRRCSVSSTAAIYTCYGLSRRAAVDEPALSTAARLLRP